MTAAPARSPLADPRVEALVVWAQSGTEQIDAQVSAAIDALTDSLPDTRTASGIALAAAAAYGRIAGVGPRDLQAGHRLVRLLARLDEPGARELVRLSERVRYQHARGVLRKSLAQVQRELRIPAAELEDAFGGPIVNDDLALELPVGPFTAVVQVSDDLRRIGTTWRSASGRRLRGRPARAVDHADALALVSTERRRLQTHLIDLRARLDHALVSNRSWTVEQWATRMFADPLRAALARRLVWRFETDGDVVLALPEPGGLRDADGTPIKLPVEANVELWHPAREPERRGAWERRRSALALNQPIDQISRQVTLADPGSSVLQLGLGIRVPQRPFRGFLVGRGWHVPHLGPWFTVPEATRQLPGAAPIAVVHLEGDHENRDVVLVHELAFRSRQGHGIDARTLLPQIVSEAARDVLGALAAAGHATGGD